MMFRPYLAIIKDAFRAAMASRVLYVLLGLITLVLMALAPLHYRETLDWELSSVFLRENARSLARELVEKKDSPRHPIVTRIWERLPEESQKEVETYLERSDAESGATDDGLELEEGSGEVEIRIDSEAGRGPPPRQEARRLSERLAEGFNEVMTQRDFYEPELWKPVVINAEAQDLIDEGVVNLSDVRVNRLNRLLISDALRSMPRPSNAAIKIYYGPFHMSFVPADINRAQLTSGMVSVIRWVFDKFVLSIGILIAIIVTSSMVPETFEPGSLNLLLSKPIHRSGLLISKFLGGTAFIAVCAVYLFLGTWLWMGLAIGTWDSATLWSIPLYVLVFAIYFSVSVLAGVIYRSPIVSVILTGVFWAFCYAIGSVYGFVNARAQNDQLVWAGRFADETVAVNKFGQLLRWQDSSASWEQDSDLSGMREEDQMGLAIAQYVAEFPVFPSGRPVLDPASQRVYYVSFSPFPPGAYQSPRLNVRDLTAGQTFRFNAPAAVTVLPMSAGPVLVTNDGRFQRIVSDGLAAPDTSTTPGGGLAQVPTEALVVAGPNSERQPVRDPNRVASVSGAEELLTYAGRRLTVFRWDGSEMVVDRQVEIDSGSSRDGMSALLAAGGKSAIVAFGNARVTLVDTTTMKSLATFRPESRDPPVAVCGIPDGQRFFVLFRNGRLWELATDDLTAMRLAPVPYQGSISGINFDANGRLLLCHSIDRVTLFDLEKNQIEKQWLARGDFLKNAYRYAVRPIYQICPKPSEFYKLVDYLSKGSGASASSELDLRESDIYRDPWSPLWSGLGFMVVSLGLACLYFSRTDC